MKFLPMDFSITISLGKHQQKHSFSIYQGIAMGKEKKIEKYNDV
jgi:hypothetical protein